jgi:hypothetical protein
MSDAATIPAFPVITDVNWEPPQQTDPVEVVTKATPLKIHADADNASYADDVWDVPASAGSPRLNNWWPGAGDLFQPNQTPANHLLRLRQFWRQVPGTFTHLPPGTQLQKSWQYTHGVSTTDAQSISVQLGIEGDGLSAGISASLSHSVTVSDQQTQTTQFTINGPGQGVMVWVLWDLMYELTVIDANTKTQIPVGTYRGDVAFAGDKHYSGAYLNYKWNRTVISSGNLVPQSRVFASASGAAA